MAPEVRLNPRYARYDFKADIYSSAMTLFEIFNEEDIEHISDDVLNFIIKAHGGKIGEFTESSKVSMHLRNVIARGWDSNPNERPALSEYRSSLLSKIYISSPTPTTQCPEKRCHLIFACNSVKC